MAVDRHLRSLEDDGQCGILDSPVEASPWPCDVDYVVDNIGVFYLVWHKHWIITWAQAKETVQMRD